jgi:FkbM family methyltransferase
MDQDIRIEFLGRLNRLAPVMSQYEAILEAMYRRILSPGQCVYDIGCHAGRHARPFLELVGPLGRVIGFEPIPAMARQLRTLDKATPNFTIPETALSNRSGKTSFAFAEGTPEESGLIERQYNHPELAKVRQIEVTVNRLDDYAHAQGLPDPDYIKIDVEGAELDVLNGARATLTRARPILSVEYGAPGYAPYGHKAQDLWQFAQAEGFVVFDLFGYRLPTLDSWLAECDRGLWDWFLVPSERADEIEAAWR